MLMHKMLVQCGYEEQNIRILCDYVGGFLELADPTRQNILASLEWLTSNTQPGDHRFFYFSGYGERVLQEEDASRARCVRIGDEPEPDSRLHGVGCASDRAVKQNISDMHVAYYHEGRQSAPMVKHPFGALENAPASPTPDEESNGPLTPDCDSVKVTSDKTLAVTSLANSSRTWMSGDMPVQRRQANHMQAKTFIWSGCHQRQVRDLHGSGILTRVFTSIFEVDFAALSAGSMTYEALFRRISEELAAQPSATISSQLFQLWISDEGQPVSKVYWPRSSTKAPFFRLCQWDRE
ncbi:hypothetical protein FRC10_006731 [Ceratobasidium sp. 414]|nr:hypothetical protein FRC10_006731 [Ceratobasidium sp. 414]